MQTKLQNRGIIIQGRTTEKTVLGKVLATGPGDYLQSGTFVPNPLKVDDVVVVLSEAGEPMKFVGEDVFMITVQDVIAVIKDDDA